MLGQRIRFLGVFMVSCLFLSCTASSSFLKKTDASHLAKIHDIRIAKGINKTIIEIEADEPLLYTSFRLSNPDRLVIEMAEVTLGQYDKEVKISEGPVRALRPSPSGETDVTRLEFELSGSVKTDIRPDGLSIVVEVTQKAKKGEVPRGSFVFFGEQEKPSLESVSKKTDQQVPAPNIMAPPIPSPEGASPTITSQPEIKKEPQTKKHVAKEKNNALVKEQDTALPPAKNVLSVRFERGERLQLVLVSDGKLSPRIFYSDKTKKRLVIDLPGVQSKRGYSQLPGDGELIQRVRFGRHPGKLRLVLDFKRLVLHASEQIGKSLKITIKRVP